MRALCTVTSGPATRAAGDAPLPPAARFLALRAPGGAALRFVVESKARVRDLRDLALRHLRDQGARDAHLFGLAILYGSDYLFADLDSKLSKYAPKNWRSSHTHGLDANGKPLLELHLAVQFYVDSPLLLSDDVTRHYYYRQLRSNLATRENVSAETALSLASLALQADRGDAPERDGGDESDDASERRGVELSAALRGSQARGGLRARHGERRGLEAGEAETLFLKEACASSDPINAHCFRLRSSKSEPEPGSVWLTLRARGMEIAQDNVQVSFFVWSSITKLSFDRKKFEIRSGDSKITLYSSTDERSKMLLTLCRETHQFSMKIAPELNKVLKQQEEERDCRFRSLNLPYCNMTNDQRVSVISTTSSNTTSGIVSDRVHSEDELEIMIDCPPAPSTESLAFAHLLDNSRNNSMERFNREEFVRRSSLAVMTQTSLSRRLPEIPNEPRLGLPHLDCPKKNASDLSESPLLAKIKCASSQCSSSCSTVVVSEVNRRLHPRRSSAESSLELGYSHTAQNSAVSDSCGTYVESDCSLSRRETEETPSELYDGLGQPATIAASSETSGVYTMGSSELTGENSEIAEIERREYTLGNLNYDEIDDHHAKRSPFKSKTDLDCVDGLDTFEIEGAFRFRTNSNFSATDSFHGDGSDPTDNKHNLLSARELSELIVGRGTYPKLKTVSDTLDSDCDYVTLPFPMEGESYIRGHEDTAPSEENYPDLESFPRSPPKIPVRIDSRPNGGATLVAKPPPPYEPPTVVRARDPPPYPESPSREEATARFVTSKPRINVLTAETRAIAARSEPSFSTPTVAAHFDDFRPPRAEAVAAAKPMRLLPPPPTPSRQPPPPPPLAPSLRAASARSQIELYHRQLRSDVDYVVYPLQDPAVSRQNYLDCKLAALARTAPRDKNGPTYRSAPYLPLSFSSESRCGSTLTLSDSYARSPAYSPAYGASGSIGGRSARDEPPPPPRRPRLPLPLPRTKSDDDILGASNWRLGAALRRLPPPPPPHKHKKKTPPRAPPPEPPPLRSPGADSAGPIDIKTLREKSRNLDLPLISALCNDRSLLKQTKAFVTPPAADEAPGRAPARRHPSDKLPELPQPPSARAAANTYVPHPGAATAKHRKP